MDAYSDGDAELKKQKSSYNTGAKAIFIGAITIMAGYFIFSSDPGAMATAIFFWLIMAALIITYDFTN